MTDTLIAPPGVHAADERAAEARATEPVTAPMSRKRRLVRVGVLGVLIGGLAFAAFASRGPPSPR